MKYKTKPIDYTGCNPVIAEHLKRGDAVECRCNDRVGENVTIDLIEHYSAMNTSRYRGTGQWWKFAEPIPTKQRIMPPERAIPVLLADGWRFSESGELNPPRCGIHACAHGLTARMYSMMGKELVSGYIWPDCIIEEVEE